MGTEDDLDGFGVSAEAIREWKKRGRTLTGKEVFVRNFLFGVGTLAAGFLIAFALSQVF